MTDVSSGLITGEEYWTITKNPPDISIAHATVPVMKFRCQGERKISTDHTGQSRGSGKRIMNWTTGHPRMKESTMNQGL